MTDEPGTLEETPITDQDVPHMQTKPEDGESAYTPFDAWVGESDHFRIPALVTTQNGRLVAAADARWDGTGDGYGLDTIVASSAAKYSGNVWEYTFANYLGDNGNKIDSSSTAFIDPALAVDGDTIYMLVDLFPGGVMISNAWKGTGFDGENLLLKKSNDWFGGYDYILGEFDEDGYALIYDEDGNAVDGYAVDEYYNLYSEDGVSNVFFADADFQVLPTSYLYLTKSTDGGKSWSAPQLLNPQVKGDDESFYGVGPGRGLVTLDGTTIMFPCYVYDGQDGQRSSYIYSKDGGESWERTPDVPDTQGWSSESQLVELYDGTIRCFFRNGTGTICYADYDGTNWSASASTGISVESNCQISAITYSEDINDKQAILLSCPSGSGRANGKIYVMLVGDGNKMEKLSEFEINSGYFGYSCLTEMKDGRIAILYEGTEDFTSLTFARYAIEDVAGWEALIGDNVKVEDTDSGVAVSAPNLGTVKVESVETVDALKGTNRPYVAYDFTLTTKDDVNYTEPARVYIPADQIADLENPVGFVVNDDGSIEECAGYFTNNKAYFVFEMPHFSTGGVAGDEMELMDAYKNHETIELVEGGFETITLSGNVKDQVLTEGLLETDIATVEVTVEDLSEEPYEEMTPVTNVTSGQAYYIRNSNGQYLNSSAEWRSQEEAAQWTWDGTHLYRKSGWNTTYLTCSSSGVGTSAWNADEWSVDDGGSFTGTYTTGYPWNQQEHDYTLGQAYTKRTVTPEGGEQTVITVTAKGVGTTYFAVGDPENGTYYTVVVSPKPDVEEGGSLLDPNNSNREITKLTTSVGVSYQLSAPDVPYGGSVDWTSSNDSIATVSGGYIIGRGVGDAEITATVKDSSGSPIAIYTIPVTVLQGSGSAYGRLVNMYIAEVKDTTAYYNFNCTTEMTPVQEGELIYVMTDSSTNMSIDFFAAPDEGYALTFMNAPGSQGDYMALNNEDPAKTDFYTKDGAAGQQQINVFGAYNVKQMIQAAMNLGCDGGMGFTRQNEANVEFDVSFRSEKLPTVTKEVISVGDTPYSSGMVAHKGDTVRFKITVTQYACQDAISYWDASLKDLLSGATFEGTYSSTTTPTLYSYAIGQNQVRDYYVTYTIQDSDLDTIITNTAQLSYTYQSTYSTGSFSGSAQAEAKISAVTFEPDSIVVDFGLPVVLDFSGTDDHGRYNLVSGSAMYGDVTVSGNKVTYTPTEVLTDVDTVTLYNEKHNEYTFNVYPATTVYYEEGFVTEKVGFTGGSTGTGYQKMSVTGHGDRYGYDVAYETEPVGASNTTEMTSSTVGNYVTFDFHGTGVEIYANCTPDSGSVMIQVYKGSEETPVKTLLVNTAMVNGNSSATDFQSVTGYNVPIASLLDLSSSPADYTVKITNVENKGKSGTVSLDGFRVHGTLDTSNTVYVDDGENDPIFVQLRDVVLASLGNVADASEQYAQQIAANTMSQVYASGYSTSVVVFEQSRSGIEVGQDLLDLGPKNELYLAKGQTVTFKLSTNAQIGLKALNDNVRYTINNVEKTLTSSTDMFTESYNDSVTITNNGDGILAITQIKAVSGISSARANTLVLQPLTADDLVPALVAMGYDLSDEED